MDALGRAFQLKIYGVLAVLLFLGAAAVFPAVARAQWRTEADIAAEIAAQTATQVVPGLASDAMCTPFNYSCPCGKVPSNTGCVPGANMNSCPCYDITNEFRTNGFCVALLKCQAIPASGGTYGSSGSELFGGGGFNPTQMLLGMGAQMLMSQLMQGMFSGGSGGVSGTGVTGYGGCTQYFQTSDISQLSNPCAQYVPSSEVPVSDFIDTDTTSADVGGCTTLSAALGLCGGDNTGNTNTNTNTNTNASGYTITSTITSTDTVSRMAPTTEAQRRTIFQPGIGGIGVPGGERGDILTRLRGATVVAGARNEENNVEVSGFLGAKTTGGQGPQTIVSRWCRTRPWATNFLSKIIPPAFFDGICKARGYHVGEPPPLPVQAAVARTTTTTPRAASPVAPVAPAAAPAVAATSAPRIKPRVDIWAVPASVPLGARTTVFWTAQGVESCIEASTDGHFNGSSLSGGAATVPITETTTFTIRCLVSDGTTVTGSAAVHLNI